MSSAADQRLGERMRQARIMAGLSQRALAAKVGASCMSISKWERGLVHLTSRHLLKVANATDRGVEFFLRPYHVTVDPDSAFGIYKGKCLAVRCSSRT